MVRGEKIEHKSTKEKIREQKQIYFMYEFKAYMRKLQGLSDEDFMEAVPRFKKKRFIRRKFKRFKKN